MGASGADLPGVGGSVLLSVLSLGLVCLVAFLVLRWLARRTGGRADDVIRVLGRCHLEPRRSVYLLGVGGRCFLVGVGDGPMSLLAEVEQTSLPPDRTANAAAGSIVSEGLAKLLRKGKP